LVSWIACAQPPTQEIDLAADRVDEARAAGAAHYAPELFSEAEAALTQARELLRRKGTYLAAVRAAAFASVRADEARAFAMGERRRPEIEARRLLLELEALLDEARWRGGNAGLDEELQAYPSRLAAVRDALASGDPELASREGMLLRKDLMAFHSRLPKAPRSER
jgi:hypothetical protein